MQTVSETRKRNLALFIFAGGMAAVVGCAAAVWRPRPVSPPLLPIVEARGLWIDTVRETEFRRDVRAPGVLVPRQQRWLTADIGGVVERICAQPGQLVKPDTVIFELRNAEVGEQLVVSRSALSAAEADHAAKQLALANDILDHEGALATALNDEKGARMRADAEATLVQKGIVSKLQQVQSQMQADLASARAKLERKRLGTLKENADAQLRADTARIEQLREVARLRQHQADSLLVRARASGVLQTIDVTEGKQIVAGAPLALLAKSETMQARLRVAQGQARGVIPGLPVDIDLRDGNVTGKVALVAPTVQDGTVDVLVDLDGVLPAGARPELSIDGAIELSRDGKILALSRPKTFSATSNVDLYRVAPDGSTAKRVSVKFGRTSGDHAEVLEGLAIGDRVVLSDLSSLGNPKEIRLR